MPLGIKFPWIVAAVLTLTATVCAAVAIGLPLWSKAKDTSGNVYQWGMWDNRIEGTGISFKSSNVSNNSCKQQFLGFKVVSIMGACWLFLALIPIVLLIIKDGTIPVAAVAVILLLFGWALCITSFAYWNFIATDAICLGAVVENYDASYVLMVCAAAFAFSAWILACFGLYWELKRPVEYVYEEPKAVEYAAYPTVEAGAYTSYPTTTYSAPAATYA